MGRDYRIELMLKTLCKNGFPQAIALWREAVGERFSIPAVEVVSHFYPNRMGRD
jgi:ABC-type phosphate transport system auxiliary subunit